MTELELRDFGGGKSARANLVHLTEHGRSALFVAGAHEQQ
jgi:hypothetical protein